MSNEKLYRLIDTFYSLAKAEELPANSDDIKTILNNIEKLETHAARKKYAEKNLKRLSSGSSRLVYLTKNNTVIKLAKNDRGFAQNKVEVNPKMKSKYLNKIISRAKNYSWLQTNYLEKISEKEFEDMVGVSFKDFDKALSYGLKKISEHSERKKPSNFDEVSKTSIYKEMKRLGEKFKLLPGDLGRISSWGAKDGHPVLIDAGLTKDVFADYYDSESGSSKSS